MASKFKIDDLLNSALGHNRAMVTVAPYRAFNSYNDFVASNGFPVNIGSIEAWFFTLILAEGGIVNWYKSGKITINDSASKPIDLTLDSKVPPGSKDNGDITVSIVEIAVRNAEQADRRFADLVACQQVKALSDENIVNYYRSCGIPNFPVAVMSKVLPFIASTCPKISEHAKISDLASRHKFVQYHTAYASTGALCMKYVTQCPAELKKALGDDGKDDPIVAKAALKPYDAAAVDAIPKNIVQLTYCFLDAAELLPKGWYQGNKAVNDMSARDRTRATVAFRRLMSISYNRDTLAQSLTTKEIIYAIEGKQIDGTPPIH
jgi:hypothetical protein